MCPFRGFYCEILVCYLPLNLHSHQTKGKYKLYSHDYQEQLNDLRQTYFFKQLARKLIVIIVMVQAKVEVARFLNSSRFYNISSITSPFFRISGLKFLSSMPSQKMGRNPQIVLSDSHRLLYSLGAFAQDHLNA